VIEQALKTSGVSARQISYIEAHGTGTSLGDPIEIAGLSKAFGQWTQERQFCRIGSAKSNIGHCESAAGIAGVTKVLLQMQHRTLVPSLHAQTLNPHIDFTSSPFIVQRELAEWHSDATRIAGISSFGAGGSNAHVVIEEYVASTSQARYESSRARPAIIVLSAKDEERLQQRVQQLLDALTQNTLREENLASIAYTLQVGREAMEQRLALLVGSLSELREKLAAFLAGETSIANLFRGEARTDKDTLSIFNDDKMLRQAMLGWIEQGQHSKVLGLWVKGLAFDWTQLYGVERPTRLSLPVYPFAQDRCWLPDARELTQSTHAMEQVDASTSQRNTTTGQTLLLKPQWRDAAALPAATVAKAFEQRWIVVCEEQGQERAYDEYAQAIAAELPNVRYVRLSCGSGSIAQRYERYCLQLLECVQAILNAKPRSAVLIQVIIDDLHNSERSVLRGLAGLLKTAQIENPAMIGQLIGIDATLDVAEWMRVLQANASQPDRAQVLHASGVDRVATLEELALQPSVAAPWKAGDVYLITGGAGGLGLLFAHEIARCVGDVDLILTGRSALGDAQRQQVQALGKRGARVQYVQMDVSDRSAVDRVLEQIRRDHGRIDGIIHSAGVIRDSFLIRKSAADVRDVLAAKVSGTLNLDEATQADSLKLFTVFSSAAAVFGNVGQADYAMANAFMDEYVRCRAQRVKEGTRAGHSVSVNWPLWADGGMKIDVASLEWLDAQGLCALSTEQGIQAFYQALAARESQVVVLSKAVQRAPEPATQETDELELAVVSGEDRQFQERTLQQLKRLFAEVSGVPTSKLDIREPLAGYGIDSVMVMRLNETLSAHFTELSKTLFFEYPTLSALNAYLLRERRAECARWCGFETAEGVRTQRCEPVHESLVQVARRPAEAHMTSSTDEPIAIIGLSGRYPQARTLAQYWDNLRSGKDCISEIPLERWALDGFYCADVSRALAEGKSYCKWGGFIDGFSEFDPLFFNISPREAEGIDPQERLFMQSCWEVLEDAGYTRATLAARHGGRVGVFAGITKTGFELYGPELWRRGHKVFPRTSFSSLTNRVSYFLNLHGPSMPIDTMCSASLTAIHEACGYLLRDECELAIAGGVNLYLHPSTYLAMSAVQMLSASGRCRSFGAGADGMVPGEGVGTVLLKRLSSAVEHGDVIYALVRGTSINHGGKTHGYTVPNPQAQRELIRAALKKANLNARAVSYIEAHGTGTELGDPIEIAGLTQAFQQDSNDTQYCALGSSKSNIGHLEAAAGIASLTKVLLQMKHRTLVPTLHAEILNPHIDVARSPFRVQRDLANWDRPVLTVDGEVKELPRVAGISSFGAGGANAHVLIEEYEPLAAQPRSEISAAHPAIIVLSARDAAALQERARQLLFALAHDGFDEDSLPSVAYTLQIGREAMEHRLALLVSSMQELHEKLNAYVNGELAAVACHRGEVKHDREALAAFNGDEDTSSLIELWVSKCKYDKLADLWVKGLELDWNALYGEVRPRRVSLPTYPFMREQYWISALLREDADAETSVARTADFDDEASADEHDRAVLLKSQWQVSAPMSRVAPAQMCSHGERWVLFAGGAMEGDHCYEQWTAQLQRHLPEVQCLALASVTGGLETRFTEYAVQLLGCIQKILGARPQQTVLVQLVIGGAERDEHSVLRGLGALLKTAQMENPKLIGQVIEMEGTQSADALVERLEWDASRADEREIRYRDGQRWVAGLQEVEG
jgi:polyketide synthase PksN